MIYFADVDECAANSHNCHAHATCTNTVGAFTCACNSGYTGDGNTCTGKKFNIISVNKLSTAICTIKPRTHV